jgi:hypothetical protein
MTQTVVAVFESKAGVDAARAELRDAGFAGSDLELHFNPPDPGRHPPDVEINQRGSGVGGLFSKLFGMEDSHPDRSLFESAEKRGHYVLLVDTDVEQEVAVVEAILNRNGAAELEEHPGRDRHSAEVAPARHTRCRVYDRHAQRSSAKPEDDGDTMRGRSRS